MIESVMFTCPRSTVEAGLTVCSKLRDAVDFLKDKATGTAAEAYITPVESLLMCFEASLWAAVDFHGLGQLQDHYVSCCRTAALLEDALEDISLPNTSDTHAFRTMLRHVIALAREGGRDCMVNNHGAHLGLSNPPLFEEAMHHVLTRFIQ
jgi:hypothetical protein